MHQLKVIAKIGCFTITGYNIMMLLGVVSACVISILCAKKENRSKMISFLTVIIISSWAGARLVYVLTNLPTILADPEYYGISFILHPWEGGYTLYGALLGGFIGGKIYCSVTNSKTGEMFDNIVIGAAVVICFLRAGEYFTTQGMGHYVEEEALQRFPFAAMNCYEEWHQIVFMYESTISAVIAVVLALYRKKVQKQHYLWEVFLVLLGTSQVLMESLREDEFIRFGFVRFSQICSIAAVGIVLFRNIVISAKSQGFHISHGIRIIVFAMTVLVCIGVEFALDKSTINNHLLYCIMAVFLVLCGFAALKSVNPEIKAVENPY